MDLYQHKSRRQIPPWTGTLLDRDRILQPASKKAGITKWVSFHTFRHCHSTSLKANNEDVKVVQELMRHANITTRINIYTKALTPAKKEAESRMVDVLLDRSRNVVESRRCCGECSMRTNVSKAYRALLTISAKSLD